VFESYIAIVNLYARYAQLIDAGDMQGLGQIFEHADFSSASLDVHHRGAPAVTEHFSNRVKLYSDGTPRTKHVTTNHLIEIDEGGETATGGAYFTVLQELPGTKHVSIICAGRYEDAFARIDGRWHFVKRHIIRDLDGDLSEHLTRF
jgi:hypothetical protein